MNKAILAHKAWQTLNDHIYNLIDDYVEKMKDSDWGEQVQLEFADRVTDTVDSLEPVLEWLEEIIE